MKERIKQIWGKKAVRWSVYIGVALLAVILFFTRSKPIIYDSVSAVRGSVVETVTATGQIKPKEYASLRFKTTGTIARMNVEVGDKVGSGQLLATIDTSDLSKRVLQSKADVVSAEVALTNSQQDVLDKADQVNYDLATLYREAPTRFSEILNLAQQSYATYVTFFDDTRQLLSSISYAVLSSQLVVNANNSRSMADTAMQALRANLENFPLNASRSEIDTAVSMIHLPIQNLQIALTTIINVVSGIPTGSVSATTLDSYKTALSTARTNLNSAVSKETALSTGIQNATIDGRLTNNTAEASLRTAQANLEKARASLAVAEQSLSDAYLRAPFAGTVATKSKQIGELVTSADQVYYILGNAGLEVVANVPEVDVARIRVGMPVSGTLDAFSSDKIFNLEVESIDPDQTTIDGVVYYKTHFVFKEVDPAFRPGMSVNLTMIANQKDNVIVVPRRAVTQKNGSSTIRIAPITNGALPEIRNVKIGLKGDMLIEVMEGINEGESVVVSEKKP